MIWEGVTHYLPHEVTAATLGTVAALVPNGSRMVASYAEPDTGKESAVTLARKWMLRWAGEPHIGLLGRARMAGLLENTGWRVRADEGLDDLARRLSDGPAPRYSRPRATPGSPGGRSGAARRCARTAGCLPASAALYTQLFGALMTAATSWAARSASMEMIWPSAACQRMYPYGEPRR